MRDKKHYDGKSTQGIKYFDYSTQGINYRDKFITIKMIDYLQLTTTIQQYIGHTHGDTNTASGGYPQMVVTSIKSLESWHCI